MKVILRVASTAAILASLTQPASAQWQGGAGLSARYLANTEYDRSGRLLVREEGWLPGISARVAYQASELTWFTEGAIYDHSIQYHGQTQLGSAVNSTTSTQLTHLRAGGAYAFTDHYAAFAALEWENWTRDIRGTQAAAGLQEKYSTRKLLAGVQGKWDMAGAGAIAADAAVVRAEPERLRVGFSGLLDPASLETKWSTGVQIGASIRPACAPRLELRTAYDWIRVARSDDTPVTRNGQFIGTIAQPEHVKRGITLTAWYIF